MLTDDRAFLQETVEFFLGESAAEVCDVTIVTSDDEKIPACKALLAIRSMYFKNLFFSDFQEKDSEDVSIGFTARVMRNLLEFAYSGRSQLTERINATYEGNRDMPYVDVADLVDLTSALDYCEMETFQKTCLDLLVALGPRYASTSCTALEAITKNHSPSLFEPVKAAFMKDVLINPRASFKVPDAVISETSKRYTLGKVQQQYGILCLSEATLHEVLRSDFPRQEQEYLFQALYFWATDGKILKNGFEERDDGKIEKGLFTGVKWESAKRLVKHLDLRAMRVMFLRDYVEPTGLVDKDMLCGVLWHHAMRGAEVVRAQAT